MNRIKKEKFFYLRLILVSTFFFLMSSKLISPVPIKRTNYLAPPAVVTHMAAGLKIQASDSFWIRALQDFDFCDLPINSKECNGKSWLYKIIDITVSLDQKFYEAYYFGSLALTIIVSDYKGASDIFEKGTLEFPKDWPLLYAAGYHALFEEKNKIKAAKLYFAAAENGAPAWVHAMAGRLAVEGGEKEYAAKILEQMIATSQDPKLIDRLKQKLMQVQK